MAIAIQTIPTLKGKVADRFLDAVRVNETQKAGTVDFSKQFQTLNAILKKAKF